MNEAPRRIISYVLVFFLGAGISAGTIYFTAIKSSNERLRTAQTTITRIEESNRRLQADYSLAQATARELTERLDNRQAVINNIAGAVNSMSAGLDDSTELIQSAIDTLARIEYLLRN